MKSVKGAFGLWVSILNRQARAYFQRELKPWKLGPGQQAYLLALFPGERIPQDELSRRLSVDKANVTRAVSALEKLGYVIRVRSGRDRREWLVSLTARGQSVRSEVENTAAAWLDFLKSAVSEEDWERTEAVLEKIARRALEQGVAGND